MKQEKSGRSNQRSVLFAALLLFLLLLPLLPAYPLSFQILSPSSADLCGVNQRNITLTANNIQNTGNQTIEEVTATLISEPNNGGVSIIEPSLYLGSITPGIISVNPTWQVQCTDQPGTYTLYVNFSNPLGSIYSSQDEAASTITVYSNDLTPPKIPSHSPTGIIPTSYLTLEVVTDEEATCKYSTIPGVEYDNQQNSFHITGGKSDKVSLQNLVDNYYNYYVRCKDLSGNEDQADYNVPIEVNAPPTAMVSLSKSSPLSVGTTEVTITVSEPVKPVPSLSCLCGSDSISVPLTGSGTLWKGYVILSQPNENKVCSFSFSSVDLSGNAGSYLSGGNLFLIDTLPPTAPTSLAAVEQRGLAVKLAWKVPAEGVKNFNMYRRSDENNEYIQYGTTTKNSFIDTTVSLGRTYTYRVSAVDEAGNEGPFSEEVSLSIQGISIPAPGISTLAAEKIADPALGSQATLSQDEIDKTITEAEAMLDQFTALRAAFKADNEVFLQLGGPERIREAKELILKKKEELGFLKSEDLTDQDTRQQYLAIKNEIQEIKQKVIAAVKMGKEKSFSVTVPDEPISEIITAYLDQKKPGLSSSEREQYILSARKMQSDLTITAVAKEVIISYLDGANETLLWIKKDVKTKDAEMETLEVKPSFIESIPKEIAPSMEKLLVSTETEVINADPVFVCPLSGPRMGTFTCSYFIKKVDMLNLDAVTRIATAVAPTMDSPPAIAATNIESRSWNFLTGNAVLDFAQNISLYNAGITLGILAIIILFIYSLLYSEKEISVKVRHDFPSFNSIRKYFPFNRKNNQKNGPVEIIYPYLAHEDYQQAGLTPLFDSTLSALLRKTEDALHCLDFEKAVKLYHLFCIECESSQHQKEKARLGEAAIRVKKKIALLTKQMLLQYSAGKGERQNLRHLLNEIADLYNDLWQGALEKEHTFFSSIKGKHESFSRVLLDDKK